MRTPRSNPLFWIFCSRTFVQRNGDCSSNCALLAASESSRVGSLGSLKGAGACATGCDENDAWWIIGLMSPKLLEAEIVPVDGWDAKDVLMGGGPREGGCACAF